MKLMISIFIAVTVIAALLYRVVNLSEPTITVSDHSNENPTRLVASDHNRNQVEPINQIDDINNNLSITIADESISVTLKNLELTPFALPDKDAIYLYEKLSDKALAGEAVAARLLSGLIEECNETHVDEALHNESLDRLREHQEYPSANPKFSGIKVSEDMIQQIDDYFVKQYSKCKGLTLSQRKESQQWARLAADGGDFLGLEQLARHPDTTGNERVALLERKWNDYGFIDSVTGLAAALSDYGKPPGYEDTEVDNVKAFAYFLIGSKLNVAVAEKDGQSSIALTELRVGNDTFESLVSRNLTPAEHLAAEQLALEMIKNNINCCTRDSREGIRLSLSE